MFLSVIDEHGEQQLVNALHIARVSNTKGAKRACIHMVGGAWIKTNSDVPELSAVIDSAFKQSAQYMRYVAMLPNELDTPAIESANLIHNLTGELPFTGPIGVADSDGFFPATSGQSEALNFDDGFRAGVIAQSIGRTCICNGHKDGSCPVHAGGVAAAAAAVKSFDRISDAANAVMDKHLTLPKCDGCDDAHTSDELTTCARCHQVYCTQCFAKTTTCAESCKSHTQWM